MNEPPAAGPTGTGVQAIRIILGEHRSLGAVLHGLLYIVRNIRFRLAGADFLLLRSMIGYVDAFADRFHHPKEDRYLFERLRARDPSTVALLEQLHEEHRAGVDKVKRLQQSLEEYERDGEPAFAAFADLASEYAAFQWGHMQREEALVLPLASRVLTDSDWEEIDAAFAGHTDPLFGADITDHYDALFRRIVELAPPPLGTASSSPRTNGPG